MVGWEPRSLEPRIFTKCGHVRKGLGWLVGQGASKRRTVRPPKGRARDIWYQSPVARNWLIGGHTLEMRLVYGK